MTAPNFHSWPHWRDKYYDLVDALKTYYPEVVAGELSIRLELIRIDAYRALIDKLMSAHEDSLLDLSTDQAPMWATYRDRDGHEKALAEHYPDLLQASEPLQVAVQHITDAKAAIDKWMMEKADSDEEVSG